MRKETFDSIASRLVGLDAEHLKEVKYEPASDTLTGIIRNPRKEDHPFICTYTIEELDNFQNKGLFLDKIINTCRRYGYTPRQITLTNIPSE